MIATQVLANHAVSEKIRDALAACRHILSPCEYARRAVRTIASVTHSQYAVWLNWPAGPESLVAETDGFCSRDRILPLCEAVPRLSNDLDSKEGVHSIAAVPIMFRSSITGVLAVANGALPYTSDDLDFL